MSAERPRCKRGGPQCSLTGVEEVTGSACPLPDDDVRLTDAALGVRLTFPTNSCADGTWSMGMSSWCSGVGVLPPGAPLSGATVLSDRRLPTRSGSSVDVAGGRLWDSMGGTGRVVEGDTSGWAGVMMAYSSPHAPVDPAQGAVRFGNSISPSSSLVLASPELRSLFLWLRWRRRALAAYHQQPQQDTAARDATTKTTTTTRPDVLPAPVSPVSAAIAEPAESNFDSGPSVGIGLTFAGAIALSLLG